MEMSNYMDFYCSSVVNGVCVDPSTGAAYECIGNPSGGNCSVSGRTILKVVQGIGKSDSPWVYVAYLGCIYVTFKLLIYILINFPWERGLSYLRQSFREERRSESDEAYRRKKLGEATSADIPEFDCPGSALCWTNLYVKLKTNGKVLINDCSGFVPCGRVLAMMGPSGAGKTTLLNALSQRADYASIEGRVLFNGRKMTQMDLTYVPQFDDINRRLTVSEHLLLVGRLTCAANDQVARRLEHLLIVLGLSMIRDVEIKCLSGGEIKRVRIGIGLISNPKVLFLDGLFELIVHKLL